MLPEISAQDRADAEAIILDGRLTPTVRLVAAWLILTGRTEFTVTDPSLHRAIGISREAFRVAVDTLIAREVLTDAGRTRTSNNGWAMTVTRAAR